MFTNKYFHQICTLFIVLIAGIVPTKAHAIGADFMPMVSLSWDKMLGLNIGLGASSGEDMFIGMIGPYVYTNISLVKPGVSLSAGHYGTVVGMISMRNGITYLNVKDDQFGGAYFGLSHSMTLIAGYYQISGLMGLESKDLHFNGAIGVGIF